MIVPVIAVLIALTVTFLYMTDGNPKPIAGVYKKPGRWYWLKRAAFYVLFHLRSRKKKDSNGPDSLSGNGSSCCGIYLKGYGQGDADLQMEMPQPLLEDNWIDSCYFGATGKDGSKLICRLARRKERCMEIWLFLEIPGIGCLQHPRHPDTDVYYTDGQSFRGGGLYFEIIEPMMTWKLSYSGKLRKTVCNNIDDKPSEFVETSFSFTWKAFSRPFNFDSDMLCSVLGDSIAREEWSKDFFNRLRRKHQTHYEQWGELRGRLNVEGHEEKWLYMQCVRDHTFGLRDWRLFHRYIVHFIYLETGLSILVGIFSQPGLMSHVKIGYVAYANGDVVSVSDVSLKISEVGEADRKPPSNYSFSFEADRQTYNVEVSSSSTIPIWYHHEDRGGKVMEAFSTFKVNSRPGWGIAEFFYRNLDGPSYTSPVSYPMISEPSPSQIKDNKAKISLFFTSESCKSSSLVGGKGAQLAQLTSVQKKINGTIPPGFCLTLKSFELQLQQHSSIEQSIQTLAEAAIHDLSTLPSTCQSCVELISNTPMGDQVKEAIHTSLQELKGPEFQQCHFAVRSSAAGEDGDEASSAGQMETILGVVGLQQIYESVKKCWASVYTHQAVEYRRQHGQPIRVLVGVVIQEMVPADAAGVLFTADPVNGSFSHLVINANFGLGESVVSGKSDPDTIYVLRDPNVRVIDASNCDQALSIDHVTRGNKQIRIVETGHGGVKEETLDGGNTMACLSNELIFKLAALGIELEKYFGSPRDIEWAVVKEVIFLLQCRPITVTDNETDEDLQHEFDSPVACEHQWVTTGNINEAIPGPVTPLSLSMLVRTFEYGLQDISTIFMSTLMIDLDIMEISLLGTLCPDFTMDQIEDYYGRPKESWFTRFLNFISMLRMFSKASKVMSLWEKKVPVYSVGKKAQTSAQLYHCICSQLEDYEMVYTWTIINSSKSGSWSTVLMSVLAGEGKDWTTEHYGDLALLLSQCQGVYSAEVPHALEDIARAISEVQPSITDLFLATPDVDCMAIITQYPELQDKVDFFLKRHGHRCVRELEFREKSWSMAPEKFISALKIVLKTKSYNKKAKEPMSISKLLDQLKTKLSVCKRFMLKLIVPKVWLAVGKRELGKSIAVHMNDNFKLAYSRLSSLMHQEGRLPDPDLLYFLTHQEIGLLLELRSSKVIMRAQKRRKNLAKQQMLKFEKMAQGRPVPIDTSSGTSFTSVDCLKGMPVSQGQMIGPARVVLSLDQASIIKAGDILIVKCTDVGWTPYFPMIGGLVTELGGLISHGAVVAREYGIPCVVNVPNATSLIKSGEKVKINGRLGTLERFDV